MEEYLHASFPQLPDDGQRIHGIPGKTTHAFGNDEVYFPIQRVGHHALEALAFFGGGSGNALVGITAHKL